MSETKTKIYFAGSIRGGRGDRDLYLKIIEHLQQYGDVLTEHVGNPNLKATGEALDERSIFERDVEWLTVCDVVVAEVTTPSLGVGYELGLAESLKKPTLCLYRSSASHSLSAMVRGNPNFHIREYSDWSDFTKTISPFFKALKSG